MLFLVFLFSNLLQAQYLKIPEFKSWNLDSHVLLFGNTEHPQGLVLLKNQVFLSVAGRTEPKILKFNLTLNPFSNKHISSSFASSMHFPDFKKLTHAGGLNYLEETDELATPLATTNPKDSASLVSVNVQNSVQKFLVKMPEHIGALAFSKTRRFAFNYGSTFIYDLISNSKIDNNSGLAFQDCKNFREENVFLCTATRSQFYIFTESFLAVVRIDLSLQIIQELPLPQIDKSGELATNWLADHNVVIPKLFSWAPLGYNSMDFKISEDQKEIKFFFAPHDEPNTTLLVFKAKL